MIRCLPHRLLDPLAKPPVPTPDLYPIAAHARRAAEHTCTTKRWVLLHVMYYRCHEGPNPAPRTSDGSADEASTPVPRRGLAEPAVGVRRARHHDVSPDGSRSPPPPRRWHEHARGRGGAGDWAEWRHPADRSARAPGACDSRA